MKFFEDRHGNLYQVSRIRRIKPPTDAKPGESPIAQSSLARVFLDDDHEDGIPIYGHVFDQLVGDAVPIIPANPGFYLLSHWAEALDDKSAFTEKTPIIGWRVGGEDGIKPVTDDWNYNDERAENFGVLRPEGDIRSDALDATYDTIEQWELAVREEQHRRRKAESS